MTRNYAIGGAAGLLALACLGTGCGGRESAPLPGSGGGAVGGGEAAISTIRTVDQAPVGREEGAELALKLEGIGSKAEMERGLAKLDDPELRRLYELAFRGCFVADRSKRAYGPAVEAMEQLLARKPGFAPALRVLAYARFNLSFDMEGATEIYREAVEADPDYGEAHYALSFMLTQFDMDEGRKHFQRAMELGVPDERALGTKFYK